MKNSRIYEIFNDYFYTLKRSFRYIFYFFYRILPKPLWLVLFVIGFSGRLIDRFIDKIFWRH